MPPPYPGCPGPSTFFSYLLFIYPYFFTFTYTFKKISLIGCPPAWMPWAVVPPAPHFTPLWIGVWCVRYVQWRAEGLGCLGPTRFLDTHKLKKNSSNSSATNF